MALLMATIALANPVQLTSKPNLPVTPHGDIETASKGPHSHSHVDISGHAPVHGHPEATVETKPTAPLSARSTPGVYMCAGPNWQDGCFWHRPADNNGCNPFVFDRHGSFGPDHGLQCMLYDDASCRGNFIGGVQYPGFGGDLTRENRAMANVKSYSCVTKL